MLLKVAGQTNVEISNSSYTVCATHTFTRVWSEYNKAVTHVTKTKVPFQKEREIHSSRNGAYLGPETDAFWLFFNFS